MSTAEIALRENGHAALAERDVVDGWLAVVSDVIKLANVIAPTDFVPEAYRDNPPAVAAAILAGRELNIGPMTSLRHVQVVKGSPSLSAEYKRARVLAAGHEFDVLELTTHRCRVSGRRRGSNKPPLEVTFTMEDAKTAGLLAPSRSGKPGAWQTRPRRMLFARAGSELCDFLFADVVNGLPTAELIMEGSGDDGFAGYDEAPEQTSPKPAQRTAQRRQHPPERPTPAAPAAATAPTAAPATAGTAPSGLPPLPGENEEPPGPTVPANGARTQKPPGSASATEERSDRHRKLVGIVHQHFSRLGFTDDEREQRLTTTAVLAGVSHDLPTTSFLTEDQLSLVADTLAKCKDRDRLIALLAAGDKTDG